MHAHDALRSSPTATKGTRMRGAPGLKGVELFCPMGHEVDGILYSASLIWAPCLCSHKWNVWLDKFARDVHCSNSSRVTFAFCVARVSNSPRQTENSNSSNVRNVQQQTIPHLRIPTCISRRLSYRCHDTFYRLELLSGLTIPQTKLYPRYLHFLLFSAMFYPTKLSALFLAQDMIVCTSSGHFL